MNDITVLTIAALSCMAVIGGFSYAIIRGLQKTIDTLTNKLMAKDYREYVNMNKPPSPVKPEDEKPLSWHDH